MYLGEESKSSDGDKGESKEADKGKGKDEESKSEDKGKGKDDKTEKGGTKNVSNTSVLLSLGLLRVQVSW
jgi:hypothetical protein